MLHMMYYRLSKLLSALVSSSTCVAWLIFNFHAKFDKIQLTSKICQPSYFLLLIKVYKKGGISVETILVFSLIIETCNMREGFCISRLNKLVHFSPHETLLWWETRNWFHTLNTTILCYTFCVCTQFSERAIRNIQHQLY